jgi:Zn-dependent peptidase ImmA (M78 family)
VPDFRTLRDEALAEPSCDLLDTLYLCQQRQDWYREHARMHGLPPLTFVGSASVEEAPTTVAARIRETLRLSAESRRRLLTWADTLRDLITKIEDAGVMVMASSVVGSNSHRKLDVGEFRGFALADDLAPLIFLNGADSKAAQMFTLAHELAHIWLGASGVSDTQAGDVPGQQTERWCNQVAAELLVPMDQLRASYQANTPIEDEIQRLAREFKVSTLVALRRLFDAGFITQTALWQHYRAELERLRTLKNRASTGGDFYRSLGARTSKRFARAIIASTLEGLTAFPDAFRMLGVRKTATFYEAARELGVMA